RRWAADSGICHTCLEPVALAPTPRHKFAADRSLRIRARKNRIFASIPPPFRQNPGRQKKTFCGGVVVNGENPVLYFSVSSKGDAWRKIFLAYAAEVCTLRPASGKDRLKAAGSANRA